MAAKDTIEHDGIVIKVEDNAIIVQIQNQSACASCHSKGACGLSEVAQKNITVVTRKSRIEKGNSRLSRTIFARITTIPSDRKYYSREPVKVVLKY